MNSFISPAPTTSGRASVGRTILRSGARIGITTGLVAGAVMAGATSASAHVTVTPSTTEAGAYSVLTFSNGHGCDGSPTTKISISIPEGINAVTPTRHADYTVDKVMETLAEPIDDGHGGQLTERVSEVVYTATTPLPDGYRDAFELQLKLPEGEAGDVVAFPVIQSCEQGETAWIDMAEEGEEEPESPAPTLTLTAATDAGDEHSADSHDKGASETVDATDADESDGPGAATWIAVALGALGVVVGGAAFVRSGSRS